MPALSAILAVAILLPGPGGAHEPITTKIMFDREVVRFLQRDCLGCHRPGGIAMSLATYDEARPWAKAIKEELLQRRMPPWPAVTGYGQFRNAPALAQRDIDVLVNWVEGGAPRGDPKDLPSGRLFSDEWRLGEPDLVLKPKAAIEVASDADKYEVLTLPTNLKEDRWLRALDLKPGSGSVVHCASFYVQPSGVRKNSALAAGDAASQSPPPDKSLALLGAWMPGQRTVELPAGTGQALPAGSSIRVRIHYRGVGEGANDRSSIGLYFSSAPVQRPLLEALVGAPEALIPAGAARYRVMASYSVDADSDAIAIRPAVNPLVVSIETTAYRPDGTVEVLAWTTGSKHDWAPVYYFREPVRLPKGTRVESILYFDNSDDNQNNPNSPPKDVRWSDLTSEPFCTLFLTRDGTSY